MLQGAIKSQSLRIREAFEMTEAGKILAGIRCYSTCADACISRLSQAGEFEGKGGPEEKVKMDSSRRPGDDDTLNLQEMKQEGIAGRQV